MSNIYAFCNDLTNDQLRKNDFNIKEFKDALLKK